MIEGDLTALDKRTIFSLSVTTFAIWLMSQLWINRLRPSDSMCNLHLLGLCIAGVGLVFIISIFLESGSLRLSLNFSLNRYRFRFLVILILSVTGVLGPRLLYLTICCKFSDFILDQALLGFVSAQISCAFTDSLGFWRLIFLLLLLVWSGQDCANWISGSGWNR